MNSANHFAPRPKLHTCTASPHAIYSLLESPHHVPQRTSTPEHWTSLRQDYTDRQWVSTYVKMERKNFTSKTGGICTRGKLMGLLFEPIMWSVKGSNPQSRPTTCLNDSNLWPRAIERTKLVQKTNHRLLNKDSGLAQVNANVHSSHAFKFHNWP